MTDTSAGSEGNLQVLSFLDGTVTIAHATVLSQFNQWYTQRMMIKLTLIGPSLQSCCESKCKKDG